MRRRMRNAQVLLALFAMMMLGTTSIPLLKASAFFGGTKHTLQQKEDSLATGLTGKTIVVDAGHGGVDSGARGILGMQEKDITLSVAAMLMNDLHQAGAKVVMTRHGDTDLATDADRKERRRHMGDLRGRLGIVRKQHIDAFVSVHCNAAPSSSWRGAQVLYLRDNEEAKALANIMQKAFARDLLPTNRSIQSNKTLYLLKRVDGPSVLAEIGFITNPAEAQSLKTKSYQEKIAYSMYTALVEYFSDPKHAQGDASGNDHVQRTDG